MLQRKLRSLSNVKVSSPRRQRVLGDGQRVNACLQGRPRRNTASRSKASSCRSPAAEQEWLKTRSSESRGEIEVDARGETSIPGVFAAGDCTTVPYKQISSPWAKVKGALSVRHLIRSSAPAQDATGRRRSAWPDHFASRARLSDLRLAFPYPIRRFRARTPISRLLGLTLICTVRTVDPMSHSQSKSKGERSTAEIASDPCRPLQALTIIKDTVPWRWWCCRRCQSGQTHVATVIGGHRSRSVGQRQRQGLAQAADEWNR